VAGLPLLGHVRLGDHVCWTVDDDTLRMESIASFVRAGLQARHRVIYTGDAPGEVLAGLRRRGIGRSALAAGQLSASTAEESYLAGGSFDPVATLELWRAEVAASQAQGFLGLRVIGDMTWASRPVPGASLLPWYEAECNTVFVDGYVAGVCAYDRRIFDPLALRRLSWAHHGAVGMRTAYDPGASLRILRTRDPWGLRLSGEVDLSNRLALRTVIGHLFDDGRPEVTIDVTRLTFADTAAARLLVTAAAAGPGRIRLVGCSPVLRRLLDFHRAGDVPALIVEVS
jgi:anti-anti-sigma factor